MAINFPDSPTTGDVYADATSGISYTWDGTRWAGNVGTTPTSPDYVLTAGDQMTGALGIGGTAATPNITLNADGTASFKNGTLIAFDISTGGIGINGTASPTSADVIFNSNPAFTTSPNGCLVNKSTAAGAGTISAIYAQPIPDNNTGQKHIGVRVQTPQSLIGNTATNQIVGVYVSNQLGQFVGSDASYAFQTNIGAGTGGRTNYGFVSEGNAANVFLGQVQMPSGSTVGGSAITSDRKFKENIAPASSQLDDVKALADLLCNYDWNDDCPLSDEFKLIRCLGLVAQDVEAVCPGLIKETSFMRKPILLSGSEKDGTAEYGYGGEVEFKALKLDVIQMKMLGAIGEVIAKNNELEARLKVLETAA